LSHEHIIRGFRIRDSGFRIQDPIHHGEHRVLRDDPIVILRDLRALCGKAESLLFHGA
jgi:hypothetical protein